MATAAKAPRAPVGLVEIGANGAEPPPYHVDRRYQWVVCEEGDAAGFAIKARVGLTLAERDALDEADAAIGEYAKAWNATPEAERDPADTPRSRQHRLVAPYIVAWNAVGTDAATGEPKPVPPPAEAGPEVFRLIDPEAASFAVVTLVNGYRLGKSPNWWLDATKSAASPATSSGGGNAAR